MKRLTFLSLLLTACAVGAATATVPPGSPTPALLAANAPATLPTTSATPAPALVPTPSDSTRLLLTLPFQVGVTHAGSNYRFSNINFLTEGADAAQQLNAKPVFVYLEPDFRTDYPDFPEGTLHWPVKQPTSLTELVQTAPYADLISRFQVIVFTAFSFANRDGVLPGSSATPDWNAERKEFHDLTQYLLTRYAGTGKVFILKQWETDNFAVAPDDDNLERDLPAENVTALIAWLSARQEGVEQARREMGAVEGVMVYHAVECNRVLDILAGLIRTCNAVVPEVAPDIVTYSAYDAMVFSQQELDRVGEALTQALNTIDRLAPDPLGLGEARIVISEFGLYENEAPPGDVIPRAQAVLETAQAFGLKLAFVWQLYDNECADQNGEPLPTALMVGDPRYPANEQCRGLWLYRPDGSPAEVLPLLQQYWTQRPAPFTVKVGEQENVLQPYSFGLTDFPDGLMGVTRQDGLYYWFVGSFAPNDQTKTYLFRFAGTDLNSMRPDPVDENGHAVPVLSPGSPGSFDDHIAGNGSVYFDAKTGKLYFWWQAMQSVPPEIADRKLLFDESAPYPWAYGAIGSAVSTDMGRTWEKTGIALTPNMTWDDFVNDDSFGSADTHPPAVVIHGDFLYLYYQDYRPTEYSRFGELTVARLPIADLDKSPQPWKKYYNGAFTESGLSGQFSPIAHKAPFATVSYNTYLGQWIMAHVSWEDADIYLRTSPDGIDWSDPKLLAASDDTRNWLMAPTLVGIGDDPAASGQEFWLYYAYAPNERAYPPGGWMVRRKVRLDK